MHAKEQLYSDNHGNTLKTQHNLLKYFSIILNKCIEKMRKI